MKSAALLVFRIMAVSVTAYFFGLNVIQIKLSRDKHGKLSPIGKSVGKNLR